MQGLYLEVTLQEVIFDELFRHGREILEKMDEGPKRDELAASLGEVRRRWDEVYDKTVERQRQLDEVAPLSQKFDEASEEFLPWLAESESMVSESRVVVCDKHALTREQQLIKVLFVFTLRFRFTFPSFSLFKV